MIDWLIIILLGTYIACQIAINRHLSSETIALRSEVERLKNWRMAQEHKQQITETALDMLFSSYFRERGEDLEVVQ